jgi:predicted dithiol-disulfide oxidoreductase (DUF899 family)
MTTHKTGTREEWLKARPDLLNAESRKENHMSIRRIEVQRRDICALHASQAQQ